MVDAILGSPVIQLLFLVLVSTLVRLFLMRRSESPTASGAIAMAIGIFIVGALHQLPFPAEALTQLLTLEGLVVWAFIATSYLTSYFRGTFQVHTADPVGCFAVGTWVAGTAVLAKLLDKVLPEWHLVALGMALITLSVWLWYLVLISRRYGVIMASTTRLKANGVILLATVSTQSVLILLEQLFPGQIPWQIATGLIVLGYFFYSLGLILIVQRYLRQKKWRLAEDWSNTNCILHGAMSITGLAAVESGALPLDLIIATWLWVFIMFILVELIECKRLLERVRLYGWRKGVFTYHVSQWSRNFTFGMFYTFTLRMHPLLQAKAGDILDTLQVNILALGQYVVLAFLVLEIGLFISHNINFYNPTRLTLSPKARSS